MPAARTAAFRLSSSLLDGPPALLLSCCDADELTLLLLRTEEHQLPASAALSGLDSEASCCAHLLNMMSVVPAKY